MDFTKEKIEELQTEAFDLYENFCLLENDIFYSGIKGKDAVLFEKPDCILQVNRYITNIREAIKWSKEHPYDKCLKILNFIFDKCEKDTQQYTIEFNATFDYEPTQDEMENLIKLIPNVSRILLPFSSPTQVSQHACSSPLYSYPSLQFVIHK